MSSPKKKAKELVAKMYFSEDQDGFHSMNKYRAKQCALIAVEEIQNLCWGNNQVGINYWNEVKREIEKL
jgi:hypothetical protein